MQPERNRVSFLKALLGATAGGVTLAKGEGGSHVHGCWAGLRGFFFAAGEGVNTALAEGEGRSWTWWRGGKCARGCGGESREESQGLYEPVGEL